MRQGGAGHREPAKKSGEIIEEYIDTVVTAPGKARDAGALVEEQQKRTEEMLRQIGRVMTTNQTDQTEFPYPPIQGKRR